MIHILSLIGGAIAFAGLAGALLFMLWSLGAS